MISTVYIAKNVYGGDGLGRLGDGRVVFVPGAWAGEQVKAEIVAEKKNFVKARLVEVVEASPDRIEGGAAVPGMVYNTLSESGELKAKAAQLKEFFERARITVGDRSDLWVASPVAGQSFVNNLVAGQPLVNNPVAGQPFFNYRNKVVYHFAKENGKWLIGYREEPSHRIVEVENDPLAVDAINAKLPEIRRSVLALLTSGPQAVRRDIERKGNVTIRWTAKTGVKWWIGDAPKDLTLRETTCGLDFEVPSDGFYQVNPQVGEELARAVVAAYQSGAEMAPEVLDLYCGVGVLGLCCQPPKLTGIESGHQAIEFAKRNAAAQKAENARFFSEQVGRNLRRLPVNSRTTVIVDPPRGGMEPNVPRWLADSQAPRIIYVSCDPATLTRDLKTICRAYDAESVQWFNMFPRTARFETLVVLEKTK